MGQSKPFRRTAIVVEDDEIQREILALLLQESDFEVIQCEDDETASLAIKFRHPSLLITDVNLTGRMNGIELASLVRQVSPDTRVIVVSSNPPASALPEWCKILIKAALSNYLPTGGKSLVISKRSAPPARRPQSPLRVTLGITRIEHNESALFQ